MSKGWIAAIVLIALIVITALWGTSTYNDLVRTDEQVNQTWAQVENVYQRRMDLIPNLVETVKGYAKHESQTLIEVTEARNQATKVTLSKEMLGSGADFAKFQAAQDGLSQALGRLLVVVEKYPDLKANENFLNLQAQLEGTENRISVERGRFNEASQTYNVRIRQFPARLIAAFAGFAPKAYFKAAEGAAQAPKVQF